MWSVTMTLGSTYEIEYYKDSCYIFQFSMISLQSCKNLPDLQTNECFDFHLKEEAHGVRTFVKKPESRGV